MSNYTSRLILCTLGLLGPAIAQSQGATGDLPAGKPTRLLAEVPFLFADAIRGRQAAHASDGGTKAVGSATNEPRILRTISVRELVGYEDVVMPVPLGTWTGEPGVSNESLLHEDNNSKLLAVDLLRGFVSDTIAIEAGDDSPQPTIDAVGTRLMVSGDEAAVVRAEQVLRTLRDQIATPLRIDYALYAVADAELREVRLAAGELARLAQPWQLVWSATRTTRSGFVAVAAQERYTRFLRDNEVEVAEKSSIADPTVSTLFEGVHVRVEPHALPGSTDRVVFGQLTLGELHEPIVQRASGVDDMSTFDVPVVRAGLVTFSGRIEDGGTLLVNLGGASEAGLRFVVAVTVRGEPTQGRAGAQVPEGKLQVMAVPVSALTTGSLTADLIPNPENGGASRRDNFWPPNPATREDSSRPDADQLERYATAVVFQSYEEGKCIVRAGGGYLLIAATPAECARIRSTIQSLHDELLQNSRVEIETAGVPVTVNGDAVFPVPQSGASSPVVVHRLQGPALLGRAHVYVRGLESTTVQDFEVEIAAKASASNPMVVSTFAGVLAGVTVEGAGERLYVDADVHCATLAELERRSIETRYGGDLYLPRSGRSHVQHRGALPSDGTLQFGDVGIARLAQQTWQLRQRVRVTTF